MASRKLTVTAGAWAGGAAVLTYAAVAGRAWYRYGRPRQQSRHETDALLDRFMPHFDVVERHRVFVRAPAPLTLDVAREQDLFGSWIARAIFRTRSIVMGADGGPLAPAPLLPAAQAMGWRILAELPGREVVLGSVTRLWEADVVFRPVAPEAFAAFDEAGYVKIAWTLRADPVADGHATIRIRDLSAGDCAVDDGRRS